MYYAAGTICTVSIKWLVLFRGSESKRLLNSEIQTFQSRHAVDCCFRSFMLQDLGSVFHSVKGLIESLNSYIQLPSTGKRRVPEVASFSYVSVLVHVSLYIQTSTFPYSLTGQTKAYLCKVLGNLPSSFQHIGACLTFTRAPPLSNSRLQHLWPLNSLSVSPSTCQCQPATDCQHIHIPAAGTPVLTRACIVWENALLHSLVLLFSTKVVFSDVLGDVTVHTGLHLKQTHLML